jgi:hypothetical protein
MILSGNRLRWLWREVCGRKEVGKRKVGDFEEKKICCGF